MKILNEDINFQREDKYTQKIIMKSVKNLHDRLIQYNLNGKSLDTIKGDDVLIHDWINGHAVFKTHIGRIQMRILYTVKDDKLIIVSHYIKKDHPHDWIPYFEKITSKVAN